MVFPCAPCTAQLRSVTLAASKPASKRRVSGAEKDPDLDMACAGETTGETTAAGVHHPNMDETVGIWDGIFCSWNG